MTYLKGLGARFFRVNLHLNIGEVATDAVDYSISIPLEHTSRFAAKTQTHTRTLSAMFLNCILTPSGLKRLYYMFSGLLWAVFQVK